jgi:hypothetical protein
VLFEARFYSTGWAFRLGLLQLRWNSQENYKGLSLEWVGRNYLNSGGLTWREFRITKRQQREAAEEKRKAHQDKVQVE